MKQAGFLLLFPVGIVISFTLGVAIGRWNVDKLWGGAGLSNIWFYFHEITYAK